MTFKLYSFEEARKAKETLCMYCGLAPASMHPDYSCPRIQSIDITEDWTPGAINFYHPEEWAEIVSAFMSRATEAAKEEGDG